MAMAAATGSQHENIQGVQAIYAAFGRSAFASIIDQLANDIEWDQDAPSYGIPIYEPGPGKEHVQNFS